MSDLLAKAKANLILDQPFFASLLLAMPFEEDNSISTMATDGERIVYNSKFMNSLTVNELTFVLAHEALHCVFQHMFRRGSRTHNRYNQAADYVINQLLVDEKVGTMVQGALLDPALVLKGGGTTEGVYDLLPESSEEKKTGDKPGKDGSGKGKAKNGKSKSGSQPGEGQGGAFDDILEPKGKNGGKADASEMAQKEADGRVRITQARNAAKMQGKLSAGLARFVDSMIKTETDWRANLRRFLSERAKTDLSFARPKRRFLADDLYLPSLTGEKLGAIVIAVDCSGSVDDKLLALFEGEARGILEDGRPSEIKVIYFDSDVLDTKTFGPDDYLKLTPIGGGGTAFSPIFEAVNAYETAPVAVVVLTDLECSDYGPAPSYPVLWASTGRTDGAEFGEVIQIKSRDRR